MTAKSTNVLSGVDGPDMARGSEPFDSGDPPTIDDRRRFLNKELSQLAFLDRLLDLAEEPDQPLVERAKFLGIFSANLDDFFQSRVAGLKDQLAAGLHARSMDGRSPAEQLRVVAERVSALVERQMAIFGGQLLPELNKQGVQFLDWEDLDEVDREYLVDFFDHRIFPVLTPLAVDPAHPFPYISSFSLNIGLVVGDPISGEQRFARVKVPPLLPRFIPLPDGERFVALEQVIAAHLEMLFPNMQLGPQVRFRVTRNADLTLEEGEADDLLAAVEMELRRRRFGEAVRLEIEGGAPGELLDMLSAELEIGPEDVYNIDGPLDLTGLFVLQKLERPDLQYEPWAPMTPPRLATAGDEPADLFAVLRDKEVLVHHPYDSFATSVEALLAQAARDPATLAIKQTLYRTSGDSAIVASLIAAAEAGKQVVALVELKARLDERANIAWAKALEEAGVHVVYGLVGLKTHAKAAMVVRSEDDGIRRYCHVGTGNYNSDTARLYEDFGLLTADPELGADLTEVFNFLTGYSRRSEYRKVVLAPVGLRRRVVDLIAEQAALGERGRVVIKANGLDDATVVDALYEASRAGVPIDLIIRGICLLRPGVSGLSETIRVRSVMGHFLEHSRVFSFGDGVGSDRRIFIGSADLRGRNLDRRVELMVPVTEAESRRRIEEVLDLCLADDEGSWTLCPDGRWERVASTKGVSVHQRLQQLALDRARRRRGPENLSPAASVPQTHLDTL